MVVSVVVDVAAAIEAISEAEDEDVVTASEAGAMADSVAAAAKLIPPTSATKTLSPP